MSPQSDWSEDVGLGGAFDAEPGNELASDNDETLLVVQLESPAALEHCEEIAAVEHLDVVFIAPNDLAQTNTSAQFYFADAPGQNRPRIPDGAQWSSPRFATSSSARQCAGQRAHEI